VPVEAIALLARHNQTATTELDGGFVYVRQISGQDAARRGCLVRPLPQSARPSGSGS
jgi:hypothetical protein